MRTRTLLTLILFFNIKFSIGQININSEEISVNAHWKIGDRFLYSNSYHKITIDNSDTISNEETNYEVTFDIKDESESSYFVNWNMSNIISNSKKESWNQLIKLCKNLNLILEINKSSGFMNITNLSSVQDEIGKRALKLKFEDFSEKEAYEFQRILQRMCTTKEGFEIILARHVYQYFQYHGTSYRPNKLQENQTTTFTGMTSDPVYATTTIILDSINTEQKRFKILSVEKLNTEQLSQIYKNYYLQKYSLLTLPKDIESEFSNINSETKTESIINTNGTILSSALSNVLRLPKTERIESLSIKLK